MQRIPQNVHYQPHRLFDAICRIRGIRTDTALAEFFDVGRPLISKVRRGYLPLSGGLLLRIHEVTGFDIGWLKEMIGDRRQKQRASENKLVAARPRSGAKNYVTKVLPQTTQKAPHR